MVKGAPLYGPWFGNSGDFLKNRLQLDHVWLVRAPKDGDYWRSSWNLLGSDLKGDIKMVAEGVRAYLAGNAGRENLDRWNEAAVTYPPE